MKRLNKKTSALVIAAAILLLAIGVTVLAAAAVETISPDEDGVQNIMQSITGEKELSAGASAMADFNGDGKVDVLDVISLKKFILDSEAFSDGWTRGYY